MKITKKLRSIIGIMLCITLIVGLLPVNAFAADEKIGNLLFTMDMPVEGEKPSFTAKTDETSYYLVTSYNANHFINGVCWYNEDDDEYLTKDSVFAKGKSYRYTLRVRAAKGYDFIYERWQNTVAAMWGSVAYVNGRNCSLNFAAEGSNDVIIEGCYTIPTKLSSARLTINTPLPGRNPSYTMEDHFAIQKTSMGWYDVSAGKWLDHNSVFEAGKGYEVEMKLSTKHGYAFNAKEAMLGIKINGAVANVKSVGGVAENVMLGDSAVVRAYFDCPEEVKNVDITIPKPAAGNSSAAYATDIFTNFGYNSSFYSSSKEPPVSFHKEATWYKDGKKMATGEAFEYGHSYSVNIWVKSGEGYCLAAEDNKFTLKVTINGDSVEPTYAYDLTSTKVMSITKDFGVLNDPYITEVDISGIVAPVTGNRPSYRVNAGKGNYTINTSKDNDVYIRNGVLWCEESGPNLGTSDSFLAGKNYEVQIYLTPNDGYQFAKNVKATVNGCTADASWLSSSGGYISYVFSATSGTNISKASLNIVEPVLGEISAMNITSNDGGNYTIRNGSIHDDTANKNIIEDRDAYEQGHTYTMSFYLSSSRGDNGYESTFDSNIAVEVNGNEAKIKSVYYNSVYASYTFEPCCVDDIKISGLTAAEDGGKPYYRADVEPVGVVLDNTQDNEYFKNGIAWYDSTANEYLTADDSFIGGHSYLLYINLKTADGSESFSPKGVNVRTDLDEAYTASAEADGSTVAVIIPMNDLPIKNIILEVEKPEVLGKPDLDPTVTGSGYYVSDVKWFDVNTRRELGENDTFERNGSYRADIYLTANTKFADNVQTEVDGADRLLLSGSGNSVIVECYYDNVGFFLQGDVTGDKMIADDDAAEAMKFITGSGRPEYDQMLAADYNDDGEVDMRDVALITQNISSGTAG